MKQARRLGMMASLLALAGIPDGPSMPRLRTDTGTKRRTKNYPTHRGPRPDAAANRALIERHRETRGARYLRSTKNRAA